MANKKVSVSISCPSCKGHLSIREMECPVCNLTIRAEFEQDSATTGSMVDRFRNLTNDEAYFLETFLRCRGIIRDVEAALGISYPTVRARLDGLLNALKLGDGLAAVGKFVQVPPIPAAQPTPPQTPEPPAASKPSAKDILSKLDSGQIDAKSALDALKN
jgi:hypothetical protein